MTDELFNQYLKEVDNSTVGTKRAGLSTSTEAKKQNLQPRRAMLESLEDADSFKLIGQEGGNRQVGYDAYETYHPGLLESEKVLDSGITQGQAARRRLDRQKVRYSKEFNKSLHEVKDEDIYEQGAREGLQSLYNISREEGDTPWTPGDVSHFRENELLLGDKENPLNIPIDIAQKGQESFGRNLATAFNPNTNENVNLLNENQYNPALYTDEGKFDKAATAQRKAFLASGGKGYSEPQKDFSVMSRQEKDKYIASLIGATDGDGRALTAGKNVVAGGAEMLGRAMDYGSEKAADIEEYFGTGTKETRQATRDFWNTDRNQIDEALGTNKQYEINANIELDKHLDNNDYLKGFGSILANLDTHLSNSIPEMAMLAAKLPAMIPVLAARVQDQGEEFKKNNGKEMTTQQEAASWATNAAVLIPEKLFLIGPLKRVFTKSVGTAGEKFFSKIMGAGKGTNLGKAGSVIKTIGFETVQEMTDQTQEQFWKKGAPDVRTDNLTNFIGDLEEKVISGREALKAGMIGGAMGGAMRGAVEVPGVPLEMARAHAQKVAEKGQEEQGKFQSPEDMELLEAVTETRNKPATDRREASKEALKAFDDVSSFEELENHPVKEVRAAAVAAMSEYKGISPGSNKHKQHISDVLQEVASSDSQSSQVAIENIKNFFNLDFETSTKEEIDKVVQETSIENIEILASTMKKRFSTKEARKIDIKSIKSEGFEQTKTLAKKKLEETIEVAEQLANVSTKEEQRIKKGFEKAKGFKKEASVDTKRESKKIKDSIPKRILKSILPGLETNYNKAITSLNQYSEEALDLALSDSETSSKLKDAINDVKQRRLKSKEASLIDYETDKIITEGEPTLLTRKKITDALSSALGRKIIADERDKALVQRYLDVAIEKNYISENAAKTYQKRLDKIAKEAKAPSDAQLKKEKDVKEKTDALKGKEPTTSIEGFRTKEDVEADFDANKEETEKLLKEINKLNSFKKLTEKQKERKKEIEAELNINTALGKKLTKEMIEFAEEEFELNDRYSAMEDVSTKLEEINIEEFFTKDELEFLNICK